jgi:hypothetical protein
MTDLSLHLMFLLPVITLLGIVAGCNAYRIGELTDRIARLEIRIAARDAESGITATQPDGS